MKKMILATLLLLGAFTSFAQVRAYGRQQMNLLIAPEWAKEGTAGGTKAMLARAHENAPYFALDTIEGFKYEPGYEYQLVVKSKKIPAPEGQDKAISRYVLVNVVSKTKVEPNTNPKENATVTLDDKAAMIDGGSWKLVDMYEDEKRVKLANNQLITLSFDLKNKKVKGYAFCNKWEAKAVVKEYKMFLDDFAAGTNACAQEDEEMLFFDNLAKVSEWKMKGNQLVLKKYDRVLLIFERNK